MKHMGKTETFGSQNQLNEFLKDNEKINFKIRNYVSSDKICEENSFVSNIFFWEDIEKTIKQAILLKKDERALFAKNMLKKLNSNLPATVYIPFKRSNFNFYIKLFSF